MTAMSNTSSLPGLGASARSEVESTSSSAAPPRARRSRALIALPLLTALGLGIGASVYWLGRGKETTNDAQVEGHVASVAARVSGQVQEVLVSDNQRVEAGDVLVVLDDRDLTAKAAAARADLSATIA